MQTIQCLKSQQIVVFSFLVRVRCLSFCLLQETVAESMTDLERKNLRRAMYSRDAARTEDDEEGEGSKVTAMPTGNKSLITCSQCFTDVSRIMSVCVY